MYMISATAFDLAGPVTSHLAPYPISDMWIKEQY